MVLCKEDGHVGEGEQAEQNMSQQGLESSRHDGVLFSANGEAERPGDQLMTRYGPSYREKWLGSVTPQEDKLCLPKSRWKVNLVRLQEGVMNYYGGV